MEEQTRDCKACIYSKNGKCAGTEECHECMWENKFKQKSYNEVEDAFQTVGIIIRAEINDLCNQKRFSEAEEIQEAYDKINKHFDNKLTFKQKTGKWKVQHTTLSHLPSDTIVTCLECGHTKSRIDGEILNFCPNCGARMVRA